MIAGHKEATDIRAQVRGYLTELARERIIRESGAGSTAVKMESRWSGVVVVEPTASKTEN